MSITLLSYQFMISIHALREEGDLQRPGRRGGHFISIHALREEGDLRPRRAREAPGKFLSTPSARRATDMAQVVGAAHHGISIHALREEGDTPWDVQSHRIFSISIHALREEGDSSMSFNALSDGNFYPRPPRGGRRAGNISLFDKTLFLSTPSARRATKESWPILPHGIFLSTPSARRATTF